MKLLYNKGKINLKQLNKFCGHLRPGTYDITVKRYENTPEIINSTNEEFYDKKQIDIFKVLSLKEVYLNRMLEKYELKFDTQTLLEYVKKSTIIRRE